MKKILIFSLAYYPRVSGAEIAVKEITDRIFPDDIEFSMVTLRFSPADAMEEQIGNMHVYRIGRNASYLSKVLFIPRAAMLARRLHTVEKFNAWWTVMSYMVLPLVLLRLIGIKLPYVLTLQDGDPFEHVFDRARIRLFKPLLVTGFKNATVVQVISNYLGEFARKVGYTGSVEVIPNGVHLELFREVTRSAGRQRVWIPENIRYRDVILITTSRLVHKNAVDVVIRALVLLPKTVLFMIFGIGPEFDALEALAKELGVRERVHFLGEVPNSKLPQYLHASDIFVRPSRTEGLGISFLEAMATGLPVIATQEGGIADFLFDAKRNPDKPSTGFAVDKDSPEQIAEAVNEILANPEATKKVIENARALVEEKYDWNDIAKSMRSLFYTFLFRVK